MKFGDNLRQIRKSKKMSQEQLAEKMNVTRQSVSKWENGEAYPEMNNILQLCKIFNCSIYDLVQTEMSDISSLDDEIVLNAAKLNNEKQKQVKTLSNIISLIGKIGAIVLKVAIPFIIIAMIIVPYIINNVELQGEELVFSTENIKIIDGDKLEVGELIIGELDEEALQSDVANMIRNNTKTEIIIYAEVAFVLLVIYILLMVDILNNIEKLFSNIKNNDTPFTLDNVGYIKRISYLMIALIIIVPLSGLILNSVLGFTQGESSLGLISVLEILIIFSMSYIFEYGYEIQKDSKGKIYS
ncbi:MAG: helix-turn-helix domain-containing protein [Firmicutes bacterium]|nr:helix-turn-helix domain-containing protein [Bacillota bacterium]